MRHRLTAARAPYAGAKGGRGRRADRPQDGATNNNEPISACFFANTRGETVLFVLVM
jgi:hypothetical protein